MRAHCRWSPVGPQPRSGHPPCTCIQQHFKAISKHSSANQSQCATPGTAHTAKKKLENSPAHQTSSWHAVKRRDVQVQGGRSRVRPESWRACGGVAKRQHSLREGDLGLGRVHDSLFVAHRRAKRHNIYILKASATVQVDRTNTRVRVTYQDRGQHVGKRCAAHDVHVDGVGHSRGKVRIVDVVRAGGQ
jgi:hypothetical protein